MCHSTIEKKIIVAIQNKKEDSKNSFPFGENELHISLQDIKGCFAVIKFV